MTTTVNEPTTIDRSNLPDGRVVAIAGPVVDVEFPPHGLPEINMAVEMDLELDGTQVTVTSEVAQQIGEGRVRCICLKPTDGLQRGTAVFGKGRPGLNLSLDESLDITRSALRGHFHTAPGKDDNFDVLTPDSVRAFVDQILGIIAAIVVPVTAISLVVGLFVFENGIALTAFSLTYGMPLVGELGVLCDLLIAVVVAWVYARRMIDVLGSTSTDHLRNLRG